MAAARADLVRTAALALLVASGLGLAGAAPGPARADTPAVVVARATLLPFPRRIEALGTARANESIEVRPQVSDRVTAIHFSEGQQVEAGSVLVELQDAEAVADVAAVRATLVDLESQLRRARELYQTSAVAASELDQRIAQRDAARAALAAAEARLADRTMRAPFAGRVGLRRVSLGSLVTPETIITTLDDTHVIKLDFDVPATAMAQVAEGLDVVGRSAAWPDEVFRGQVASVDTRVDPVSRSVTVRALVANDDGRLRPGMFLTVEMTRDDVTALVVPEHAIVPEESRQSVLVVDEQGRVEKRSVQTGRRRPGQVEILRGLEPGERVIVEGTQKARPGSTVEVVGELALETATAVASP